MHTFNATAYPSQVAAARGMRRLAVGAIEGQIATIQALQNAMPPAKIGIRQQRDAQLASLHALMAVLIDIDIV